MAEEAQEKGDFIITLSSDMLADIVERYFNAEMLKMKVKVVDLEAVENGHAFTLAFVTQKYDVYKGAIDSPIIGPTETIETIVKNQLEVSKKGKK